MLLVLQAMCWSIASGTSVPSQTVIKALDCLGEALQDQQIAAVIGQPEHMAWACAAIGCVHQIVRKGKALQKVRPPSESRGTPIFRP